MSKNATDRFEPNDSIDRRTKRARWEAMEIALARPATVAGDAKVNVRNVSKAEPSTYTVTVDAEGIVSGCTCPDWQQREPEGGCKHMRRVKADDATLIACTGDVDASKSSAVDCDQCDETPGEWPCARCYIAGRRDLPNE